MTLDPLSRAIAGTVQTSQGCPCNCEFCDIVQYAGRRQRHKPVAHVLSELDLLYGKGCREVFLCDDNLTANRGKALELLTAMGEWNRRREGGPVLLTTQMSIDAAGDPELLRACAKAGLTAAFLGIEGLMRRLESASYGAGRPAVGLERASAD